MIEKRPLAVVEFDDGFRSDYTLAFKYLESRGIPYGTSYIFTSDIEKRISPKELREMQLAGWEFGDHTYAHSIVPNLTDDKIRESLEKNARNFKKLGLKPPHHFAYPNRDRDERTDSIVSEYHKTWRVSGKPKKWEDDIRINTVTEVDINPSSPTDKMLIAKQDIDLAASENRICFLMGHAIYENWQAGINVGWSSQFDMWKEVIDYAIDKGLQFVTVSTAYELVRAYQQQEGILT